MKKVAKTLSNLPNDDVWNRILDPKDNVDDIIEDLQAHWAYDLYSRNPGPALLGEGGLQPTDLDLACFIAALGTRGAVIDLPTYERRRPATRREGERVVSNEHRHGKVLGMRANQDVFSFSVTIHDMNVVTQDKDGAETVGAPRNFMLVDLMGVWYEGWRKIVFSPSQKENAFLDDKKLWTGNTIYFENFVHPNRWTSFYGRWYILTKVLIARLKAEAANCFQQVKFMKAKGVPLPATGPDAEFEVPASETVGAVRTEKVTAFEAEVDAPIPESFNFDAYEETTDGLIACKARLKKLRYYDVPSLVFAARATELAFAKKADLLGPLNAKPEPFPSWVSGASWDHAHKIKRTTWNRLVLATPVPFEKGIALRYRVYEKTEKVAG